MFHEVAHACPELLPVRRPWPPRLLEVGGGGGGGGGSRGVRYVYYRVIAVHPTDRLLLGLSWRSDTLWTEPFISVSGRRRTASRQWLMPCCDQSERGMSFMPCTIWTISLYLTPLTPRNVAGRCRRLSRASWRDPRLSFLGILIDSKNDTLSFPADKCARLRSAISESRNRKRELLSLIGQLQHACRVRAGRTFCVV